MRRNLGILLLIMLGFGVGCSGETGFYDWDAAVDAAPDVPDDGPVDVPDADSGPDADVEQPPECGNGRLEEGEVCDDGNTRSGDGCNASCTLADGVDFVANAVRVRDQEDPVFVGSPAPDGPFVLLFTDWSGADGGGAGIRLAGFEADGRKTGEVTVNHVVGGGNQHSAAGAAVADRVLVAWINEKAGATFEAGVRARILDFSGAGIVPEFQVDTSFTAPDLHVSVASNPLGIFLVVWTDTSGEGGADLRGRFFDSAGAPQVNAVSGDDGEFTLGVPIAGLQLRPRVTAVSGNRWLVVYEDASGTFDAASGGVTAAVLAADGTVETTLGVNELTAGRQVTPAILATASGFVACWIDNGAAFDLWEWGVHCRRFDLDFSPVGGDFLANVTTPTSQLEPALCPVSDGFLVIWEDWSSQDGYGAGVVGRRFAADGTPEPGELAIPFTVMGHQTRPVCLSRGDLQWFGWEDTSSADTDTDGRAIRMRSWLDDNLVAE
jgi:cysteine-rich repeat protein